MWRRRVRAKRVYPEAHSANSDQEHPSRGSQPEAVPEQTTKKINSGRQVQEQGAPLAAPQGNPGWADVLLLSSSSSLGFDLGPELVYTLFVLH